MPAAVVGLIDDVTPGPPGADRPARPVVDLGTGAAEACSSAQSSRMTGIGWVSHSVASIQCPGSGRDLSLGSGRRTRIRGGDAPLPREISHQLASPDEMPAATPTSRVTERPTSHGDGPTDESRAPRARPSTETASR